MMTGHFAEVKEEKPQLAGMQATTRWLIAEKEDAPLGPRAQDAPHFAMRVIEIKHRGEKIPLHRHDYEHGIFIIEGNGHVLSPGGTKPVAYGNFVYVTPGEEHGFESTGDNPFRFVCVIPRQ